MLKQSRITTTFSRAFSKTKEYGLNLIRYLYRVLWIEEITLALDILVMTFVTFLLRQTVLRLLRWLSENSN